MIDMVKKIIAIEFHHKESKSIATVFNSMQIGENNSSNKKMKKYDKIFKINTLSETHPAHSPNLDPWRPQAIHVPISS